jgi:NAD(P)-dependent dehydrogenase (short-subunit alcohol dehydrogenase family)
MQAKRKVMIVTGAAKGIGGGVTNAFIEDGYNVVANSLSITASTFEVTDRLAVIRGDTADPSTAYELTSMAIKTFGWINGAVNNAGILRFNAVAPGVVNTAMHANGSKEFLGNHFEVAG